MQILGRACEACGATTQSDADGCGACDVALCGSCLRGTSRCPSCQRAFDETRDAPARAEKRDDGAERGRRQAVAVAVTMVGALGLVAMLGGMPMPMALLHVVALGLLFLQLFRGRGWARWILVAYAGLVALANGHAGITRAGSADGPVWIFSSALALIFAWCVLVLALSAPVKAFVRVQRVKNP